MTANLFALSSCRSGKSWSVRLAPIYFLLLFFVFSSASALELTGVSIEPSEIAVGRQVQITIELKGKGDNSSCGLMINFGDGSSEHIRIEENKLPLKLAHTYDKTGVFSLSAEGKTLFRGFNTSITCSGSTHSAAVNVRAEDFAEKEAIEQAAKEAAFKKAAEERQAAERAAEIATAERIAAEKTARKAASERSAAERATQKATADRYAAEKAAASVASARAAAENEAARNAAAQRAAEKASADRLVAEKAASANDGNGPARSSQPEAEAPKKSTPIKARSAMDL